ncbi:hypothetical protein [Niveispirillum sp.]|uniref:hypothetical protein n=1 Tax=Niveispirillum sp. TaxID=1917217 RepID=UPI001B7B1EDD|nr:hypothetical protein [Niveispirillum sp.]MBP7336616.1 hypothetical protein [Niveispirillum sp.]
MSYLVDCDDKVVIQAISGLIGDQHGAAIVRNRTGIGAGCSLVNDVRFLNVGMRDLHHMA